MSTITFEQLALQIEHVSDALTAIVSDAINQGVTTRAWLTGYYIVEYEQQGEDRAQYGEQLLPKLSKRLQGKSFGLTNLKAYRKVYLTYTQLYEPVASYLRNLMEQKSQTPGFLLPENITTRAIGQTSDQLPMTTSDEFSDFQLSAGQLFTHLSFSHLVELSYIEDPLQRIFYEHQSVQGTWSVRELKRQIDTNYYLRSGWSKDPLMLQRLTTQQAERNSFRHDIKQPFTFEFLGLPAKSVLEETDLEQAIMDHLQDFILELGLGFCFEARQKKILIDGRYFKADLVFYHRILKCHVLVELKARRLDYSDIAQLDMYLGYYRKNIMQPDDNPPVGILLCTEVGQEMVEYIHAGIDEQLFISKYLLQLPEKDKMKQFIKNGMK